MTDAVRPPPAEFDLHTGTQAKRRLRARYAAEARFKALGLGALLIAALFLLIFLTTIFREGVSAFFQHYVTLGIQFQRNEFDATASLTDADRAEILAAVNYDAMVARATRRLFPSVTDRAGQRAIGTIVSSGAPVILRNDILGHKFFPGSELQPYAVPLDDLADLYLKGTRSLGRIETLSTRGPLVVSDTSGTVRLSAPERDFGDLLDQIRAGLSAEAARERAAASAAERIAQRLAAEIETARARGGSDTEERTRRLASDLAAVEAQAKTHGEAADALQARIAAPLVRLDPTLPSLFVRAQGGVIKLTGIGETEAEGSVILPLSAATAVAAGGWTLARNAVPEASRRFNDTQAVLVESLKDRGLVERRLSRQFFTGGASREPELAGIWSALVGSFMTLAITLALSFPIGVGAAIYLEEFAPRGRLTEIIEVNINNLAAVPSIIFGLLGLAIFLNLFGLPRSAALVGGMVLALMTLPIIIIASRAAIRAVPPSIKEAALGVGASHMQAVVHHVLPQAMPGILTGTILGMAHALGETAPLLLIGMVAFVTDVPTSLTDPATLLPVQIFMWADFPEIGFQQKTAGAIIVLLFFLVCMNGFAVTMRKKFEKRW